MKPPLGTLLRLAAFLALLSLVMPSALAQAASQPPYLSVVILQVQNDLRGEWEALQKEYIAALRKKGGPARNIWRVLGGPTNEYHILTPLEKIGDLDDFSPVMEEGDGARWVARVTKCLASRRAMIVQFHGDLSIPAGPDRIPKMAELILHHVSPGQRSDFVDVRKNQMLPTYKKAGTKGLYVYQTLYGDSRSLWAVSRLIDSWGDLDAESPLQRVLGEQDLQALLKKFLPTIVKSERFVLAHQPDLSYNPQ